MTVTGHTGVGFFVIDEGRTELRRYCMTAWSFRPFVRNHPDLAWALLEAMVGRVREAQSPAHAEQAAAAS